MHFLTYTPTAVNGGVVSVALSANDGGKRDASFKFGKEAEKNDRKRRALGWTVICNYLQCCWIARFISFRFTFIY